MTKLPQRLPIMQMQQQWASIIDPILSNPTNNSSVLKNISLVLGANVVPHKLGQPLQGWIITRQRALASVYDTQDTNQMPDLTLNLVASAPVVVDLMVF